MVFHEPMTSLNPVHTVGRQIAEVFRIHRPEMPADERRAASVSPLREVGIGNPEQRCDQYPHQLSGGMRAHGSTLAAIDAAETSTVPISMSHTGARALWNSKRLATDDALKAVAAGGGVIGIEAAPHTTITSQRRTHNIDSVMEHFEYVANLVGIDHVTFGTGTNWGDHVGLHNLFAKFLSSKETRNTDEFPRVEYVKGVENPRESSKNLLRWMVGHGYSDDDIGKVTGGNVMRVLRAVWK